MEIFLQEEQGIYEAAEEIEHNLGINKSMVNWYNVNFHSSFTNTGEFASRGNPMRPETHCENCNENSQIFLKQRDLLMKQDQKLEEYQVKLKSTNEEVKHLKIELAEAPRNAQIYKQTKK